MPNSGIEPDMLCATVLETDPVTSWVVRLCRFLVEPHTMENDAGLHVETA